MEQQIVLATTQDAFNQVNQMLEDGWILHPELAGGNPLRLERGVVYHMALLTDEELQARPQIVSIKSVPLDEADGLLAKGYEIRESFSKSVTLVKKASLDRPYIELAKEIVEEAEA